MRADLPVGTYESDGMMDDDELLRWVRKKAARLVRAPKATSNPPFPLLFLLEARSWIDCPCVGCQFSAHPRNAQAPDSGSASTAFSAVLGRLCNIPPRLANWLLW